MEKTTMALTLDDFNRAAALDRDAMKLVDDAVMMQCRGEVLKYAAAYDALFRAAKAAAPAASSTPRPETDEELDESIRAVMAEKNVSYFEAFTLIGKGEHRQRRAERAGGSQPTAADPTKSSAAVCQCCQPKIPGTKDCGCRTKTSTDSCSCHADCSICIELKCGGVNAAEARASFVADRVLGAAAQASSGRRRAMCRFDQPFGRGARIVALREDCSYCRSGRPHPGQTGPEAA
jgi:hypothetical protein